MKGTTKISKRNGKVRSNNNTRGSNNSNKNMGKNGKGCSCR